MHSQFLKLGNISAKISVRAVYQLFSGQVPECIHKQTELEKRTDGVSAKLAEEFRGIPIFQLPVIYDLYDPGITGRYNQTKAFMPNAVNYQLLDKHLAMPRPYGPRMSAQDAIHVITTVMQNSEMASVFTSSRMETVIRNYELEKIFHWANADIENGAHTIAIEFQDSFDPEPQNTMPNGEIKNTAAHIRMIAEKIVRENPGKFIPGQSIATDPVTGEAIGTALGQLRSGWQKINIPGRASVDVFELYIQTLMDNLGLNVHWIDSWFYHVSLGELHCGTNVLRST
jgi:hypothetical protein